MRDTSPETEHRYQLGMADHKCGRLLRGPRRQSIWPKESIPHDDVRPGTKEDEAKAVRNGLKKKEELAPGLDSNWQPSVWQL
jgi:hypothetical protein